MTRSTTLFAATAAVAILTLSAVAASAATTGHSGANGGPSGPGPGPGPSGTSGHNGLVVAHSSCSDQANAAGLAGADWRAFVAHCSK